MLIFPFNQLAHYLRCLTLADQFSPYFRISFASSDKYDSFILDAGYEVFPCKALNASAVMPKVQNFDFSWINEPDLELVLKDQLSVIAQYKPLLVLGDTSLTLKMAAESSGVFYISLMNAYMSKYYRPGRKLSTAHPLYRYLKYFPLKILTYLTPLGEKAKFREIHVPFKKLRKRYGLRKQLSYPDELEGDLTLLCDLPELFPQKTLPQNYVWVPPLFFDSGSGSSMGIQKQLDPGKKTVFVSMGSTGDWQQVTFLDEDYFKRYNLVIAGDSAGVIQAAHAVKASFLNMREVLPFADLVLCHGGNGTTYQALLFGIPLLCICSHFEQEWNVHELEQAGLAGILNGKTHQQVFSLTDEWISKKNSPTQLRFKTKMDAASRTFEGTVQNLAQDILTVNASLISI